MTEDWRSAYGRVKMELEEFRGTIVPALVRELRVAERERDAANRLVMGLEKELEAAMGIIKAHGLMPEPAEDLGKQTRRENA